jgi:hypothetical protein
VQRYGPTNECITGLSGQSRDTTPKIVSTLIPVEAFLSDFLSNSYSLSMMSVGIQQQRAYALSSPSTFFIWLEYTILSLSMI